MWICNWGYNTEHVVPVDGLGMGLVLTVGRLMTQAVIKCIGRLCW